MSKILVNSHKVTCLLLALSSLSLSPHVRLLSPHSPSSLFSHSHRADSSPRQVSVTASWERSPTIIHSGQCFGKEALLTIRRTHTVAFLFSAPRYLPLPSPLILPFQSFNSVRSTPLSHHFPPSPLSPSPSPFFFLGLFPSRPLPPSASPLPSLLPASPPPHNDSLHSPLLSDPSSSLPLYDSLRPCFSPKRVELTRSSFI